VQRFITRGGITTATGYPLQITGGSRIHLRTLLVFRYRSDNELCSAAAAAATAVRARRQVPDTGGPLTRRRRRDAGENNKMSQQLIGDILADEDKLVGRNVVQSFHGQLLIGAVCIVVISLHW